MKVKVTKAKGSRYNATFYDSNSNIIRVDKKLSSLDLIEISKETIIKFK